MNLPWYYQEPFMPAHPQDLVLWLNSSSWDGTTWRNLAPSYSNVNHSTLMNGVAIGDLIHPSGVFGAPRKFDGSDNYVDCGNDSSLNITDAITIEAWVKVNDFGSSSDGVIIGGTSWNWHRVYIQPDALHYRIYIGTNAWYKSRPYTFEVNQWYHIAVVGDKADEMGYWYVNGEQIGSGEPKTVWPTHSNCKLRYIGAVSGTYGNFDGTIDEVKVYSRALSASDVVHNYTHSPIYYMQHGIDPLSLLLQTPQEAAHVVV